MWKSATTKIFLSFTLIILTVSFFSIFSFAKIILEQEENYTYDIVASRSQALATAIDDDLKSNLPIEKIILKKKNLILKADSSLLSGRDHNFSPSQIAPLAPTNGSLVTKCFDKSGQSHLCAFTPLENFPGWAIETTPLHSLFENLLALAVKLLPYFFILLSLSFALAFILSKLLFSPLKKFIEASKLISSGHYHKVDIPYARKDELEELSLAFSRMMDEIQDREKRLTRTSMKLVHSARLASLGQLGASIAHEIKNPLTAIIGHAKIIQDSISDFDLKESIDIIRAEGDRCHQVLRQMLRFSRDDSEEMRDVSVREILDSTLMLIKAEVQKTSTQINLFISSDELISARPQQTQQVFLNLILNSIQAMERGGSIEIKSHKQSGFVWIDFKDSGPGISFDHQDHLFEPFFTTKPKTEGTGLGLSIAQSIMTDQGGDLELVESRPGCTIFRLHFRLVEALELDSAQGY